MTHNDQEPNARVPLIVERTLRCFLEDQWLPARIQAVAGGFSGTGVWRVITAAGEWCLKRWPSMTYDRERVVEIHRVLSQAHQGGIRQIPVPLASRAGDTLVPAGDAWWECAPWMPGKADFHQDPNHRRLAATMVLLARFHRAVADPDGRVGPATGLIQRRELLERLIAGDYRRIAAAVSAQPGMPWHAAARRMVELFPVLSVPVARHIERGLSQAVNLQPCIRDLWHDHVLFSQDEVSGIVDFGAMACDHVAADLARLLGSLLGDHLDAWQPAIQEYGRHHPLHRSAWELVTIYHRSGLFLSGWNWLRWLYLEHREFSDPVAVRNRVDEVARRQERLADVADLRRNS